MSDAGRCTGCGAKIPGDDGACPYCGTADGAHVAAPAAPDPAKERAERFRRVREHGSFERWKTAAPASRGPTGTLSWGVFVGVATIVAAVFFLNMAGRHGGLFILAPIAIGLTGVWFVVSNGNQLTRFRRARTNAWPVLVAAKRTHVRAGEHGGTDYFVTLEFESGARREYEVAAEMFGTVVEDDMGVAYVRDAYLTGFRRVDV